MAFTAPGAPTTFTIALSAPSALLLLLLLLLLLPTLIVFATKTRLPTSCPPKSILTRRLTRE